MQWSQGVSGLKCCHISALCMQQLVVCPVACQNFFNLFARNPFTAHFLWDILDLAPRSLPSKRINKCELLHSAQILIPSGSCARRTVGQTQTWECTIWGRGEGGLCSVEAPAVHWSGLWTQNEATIRRWACSSTKRCIRLQAAEFQFAVRKLGGSRERKRNL